MGVVISITGAGDAPLMMSPEQFARMATAMEAHPATGGARCEVCGRRPDNDEFAIVEIQGIETWVCDSCRYEFGDCPMCDTSHNGRPCPVDAG